MYVFKETMDVKQDKILKLEHFVDAAPRSVHKLLGDFHLLEC